MKTEVALAEGVTCTIENNMVVMKAEKGEVKRSFLNPRVSINQKDGKIVLESKNATKKEKMIHNTYRAHLNNMMKGAKEGHVYKLKICSGHFPMNVSLNGNEITIKNFIGEKVPRVLKFKEGVDVKLDGTEITVTSVDKELAGQTAAEIEKLTRIKGKDLRIFQDGIYIINKDGKDIM